MVPVRSCDEWFIPVVMTRDPVPSPARGDTSRFSQPVISFTYQEQSALILIVALVSDAVSATSRSAFSNSEPVFEVLSSSDEQPANPARRGSARQNAKIYLFFIPFLL